MRAVAQRVSRAEVRVEGELTARISRGLLVLLGVEAGDTETDAAYMVKKLSQLRVFEDDSGNGNLSVMDTGGEVLVVSQFTLLGDVRKGNRPSFTKAAEPGTANALYLEVVKGLARLGIAVGTGRFRAMMDVELVNDGPVTVLLDSRKAF